MKHSKGRTICLFTTLAVILAVGVFLFFEGYLAKVPGKLYIGVSEGNVLYFEDYDFTLVGTDKDGVTYFCLPSYIRLSTIDMSESPGKIYLEDGGLLSDPMLGQTQDVYVDLGDGGMIPWKLCFMSSANLHTVMLSFDDMELEDVVHGVYSPISINIISPTGSVEYSEQALIKGRGNATWNLGGFHPDKRPYEIKFDHSRSLGNISPSRKWALLSNTYEGTGILNKMVLDTARNIGMKYVTESEWVDLYADGRYIGNYLVCTEPQVSAGRVVDAGGYIIEKNDVYYDDKKYGFRTDNDAFTIKAPDYMTEDGLGALEGFVSEVDEALGSGDSNAFDLIDIGSFARWHILEEFFLNDDALATSCFFYTDRDMDKLYAGPPWDFDGTCGEDYGRYIDYRESILDTPEEKHPLRWYGILYDNSEYREYLQEVFAEYEPVLERLVDSGVDDYYDVVSASMEMDRAIWGFNGYGPDYTVPGYYKSVENNIRYTKFFLYNRLAYLANEWGYGRDIRPVDVDNGTMHVLTFVYPDGDAETMSVPDGARIGAESYPMYDEEKYSGWVYETNGLYPSEFIPIYEDAVFELKERKD